MFRRNLRQRVTALDGIVGLVFGRCERRGWRGRLSGDGPRGWLDALRFGRCERRGWRGRARRHRGRRCRALIRCRGRRRCVSGGGRRWLHRWRGRRRGGNGCRYRRRYRCGGDRRHDRCCRGRRRRRRSRTGRRGGRIEQQGVLAHQTARGPCHFQDHVDKRLLNRAVARQAQIGAAVRPTQQFGGRAGQHIVVVNARRTIRIRRRHSNPQIGRLFRAQARDVDLGLQGFAQRRLHRQPPQAQGPGLRNGQPHRGCRHVGQDESPSEFRATFQGVSQ